ncbi:unnamed protein product [Ciceribacter sp. T2.26MG-112.2]|nr:unnamed protein product [Ciceribacter naphthalenivorans]
MMLVIWCPKMKYGTCRIYQNLPATTDCFMHIGHCLPWWPTRRY